MQHASEQGDLQRISTSAASCSTDRLAAAPSSQVHVAMTTAGAKASKPHTHSWQITPGSDGCKPADERKGETSTMLMHSKGGLAVVLPHRSNGWFYFSAGGQPDSCAGGSGGGRCVCVRVLVCVSVSVCLCLSVCLPACLSV